MPLHQLSIFSKDTDANATIKGYEFQKLRTLEVWLESYLAKADEVTYCEYQDDIFSQDRSSWISRFRQIKLYASKNFSFKSEEVTKAIFNFFMLFIKGEFKFDDVQFWFETNTGIARTNGDNGAELLKEWHEHQSALSSDLLARCSTKIREVVSAELGEDATALNGVTDAVWLDFTQRIHWQFDAIDPNTAIENSISRIQALIAQTNFPIAREQPKPAFHSLIYEVSKRSMVDNPENRKLDSQLMDKLLLTTLDRMETVYAVDWENWQNGNIPDHFRAAEFYQLIAAANYCHHQPHLRHHLKFWQNLLENYIVLNDTPLYYQRRAAAELIWCASKNLTLENPLGSLLGLEPIVELYFGTIVGFKDYESLYEAINLLVAVFLHVHEKTCELELRTPLVWQRQIRAIIHERIAQSGSKEEVCYYNELAALLIHYDITGTLSREKVKDVLPFYQAILSVLKDAPRYNVYALATDINRWLDQLMRDHSDLEEMEPLQEVYDQLSPFVDSSQVAEANAERFIQNGKRYLETTDRNGVLKALTCFHKASALFRRDKTKRGYILALLNIGQLYNIAGCNLAAKYYTLSAAWQCTQYDQLHDLLPDALGLVYHMDHAQGNWLSSWESFRLYINARSKFNMAGFDLLDKNLQELAFTISAGPKVLPGISNAVNRLITGMGDFYELYLENYVQEDAELDKDEINQFIAKRLDDRPFNDAGPVRTIEWHAAGLSWKINFANTWRMNALGEEFCAILQILLLELIVSKADLHLLEIELEVDLELGEQSKDPVRKPKNQAHWTVYLPEVPKDDYNAIEKQTPVIVSNIALLLEEVSLLPGTELTDLITGHFDRENLAGRTLPDFLYQQLYRNLFTKGAFDDARRGTFEKAEGLFKHKTFSALRWNASLSPRYSSEIAMNRISERYKGFTSNTYLTLDQLKRDPGYPAFITVLRAKGWLDWQILMAISNRAMSHKVHVLLGGNSYASEQDRVIAYQQEAMRIHPLPEEQTYIPVALSYFTESSFNNALNTVAKLILDSYQLEYRAAYPVFDALLKFVRARLRFSDDDLPELSPL